ncbi:MAG: hypothetical protein ACC707_03035 [Thiohalomonadales bacterium]
MGIVDLIANSGKGGQTMPMRQLQMAQGEQVRQQTAADNEAQQRRHQYEDIGRSSSTTEEYMSRLNAGGFKKEAQEYGQMHQKIEVEAQKIDKGKREEAKEESTHWANILSNVTNQKEYDSAIAFHMSKYKDSDLLDMINPKYNAKEIGMYRFGALSASEGIKKKEFQETEQKDREIQQLGTIMDGRNDQQSYAQGRDLFKRLNPESELNNQIPETYSPNAVQSLTNLGRTPQEVQSLNEKQRHNIAAEGKTTGQRGTSQDERLLGIMRDSQIKIGKGQSLTKDEEIDTLHAQWVLTQPTLKTSPDGKIYQVDKPPLPWTYQGQPGAANEAPQPNQPAGNDITLKPITEKNTTIRLRKKIGTAFSSIESIIGFINESEKMGDTVTGIVGSAKAQLGGLARQAGIDVSPRAGELKQKLELLQAQLVEPLLNEKKITDAERETIKRLVGDVSAAQDSISLRSKIKVLAEELFRIDQSAEKR